MSCRLKSLVFIIIFFLVGFRVSAAIETPVDSVSKTKVELSKKSLFYLMDVQIINGVLKYNFNNESGSKREEYRVSYNSFGLSAGIGYRYKPLQVSISGGFLSLHYWNDYHVSITDINIGDSVVPDVFRFSTHHSMPKSMVYANLDIQYNISLTSSILVAPYFSLQGWKYLNNKFYPFSLKKDIYYEFENNYSYGYGITLKGVVSNKTQIFAKAGLLHNNFEPAGYFESVNAFNLDVKNTLKVFSIGFTSDF